MFAWVGGHVQVHAATVAKPSALNVLALHVHLVEPATADDCAGQLVHEVLLLVVLKVLTGHTIHSERVAGGGMALGQPRKPFAAARVAHVRVQVPVAHRLPAGHVEQAAHAAEVVKPVAEKKLTEHVHCAEPATATLLVGQLVQVALAAAAEKVLARHAAHQVTVRG
jgi:hypothetical protein